MSDNVTYKTYPFTNSQDSAIYQQDFCLHKNVCQIPVYVLSNPDIDIEIMKQAIITEVARNDALRIRCLKDKDPGSKTKTWKQYFLPEVKNTEIPYMDFRGKTDSDMLNWLRADAAKPVKLTKNEIVRFKLFHAPDGRVGVYMIISHVAADMMGVFITFQDLFKVYSALAGKSEMPAPLSSYEEGVIRELKYQPGTKAYEKNDAYYKAMFENEQMSFFAGIDKMRQLNTTRAKKKIPDLRYVNIFDPLHDRADVVVKHISGDDIARYNKFCAANKVTLQDLISVASRIYLSSVNERTDDVYWHGIVHRRSTIVQKNHCGCYMHALPHRTIIHEDQTFMDAVQAIDGQIMEIYRHADHPAKRVFDIVDSNEKRAPGSNTATGLFSVLPPGFVKVPEGFTWEAHGVCPGRFAMITYLTCVPSFVDDGLDCYLVYKTHVYTEQDVKDFLEGTFDALERGIAEPEIAIGKLLDVVKR